MKNEEAKNIVDDYVDGLLEGEALRAFEAALADSEELQLEVEALGMIRKGVEELPSSITPDRDLWPGIAARLESPSPLAGFWRRLTARPSYPVMRYAFSGAALVVFALGVGMMFRYNAATPSQDTPPVAAGPEARQFEDQYVEARTELMDALDERREDLTPEMLAVVEENLAIMEGAVNEIHAALANSPNDETLEQMLHAAYQNEVNLLHQAVQIADES